MVSTSSMVDTITVLSRRYLLCVGNWALTIYLPPRRFAVRPSAERSLGRSRPNTVTRASIPKKIRDTPF